MTINENLSHLRTLLLQMRSQLDQADAHVPEINNVVRSIAELQIVAERTLLGHVVHMQEYSPQTQPVDSGIVLQAALDIPRGIGIAAWDSEVYHQLRRSAEGLEFQRSLNFISFEELEPAIRALLLPHVESLLLRLIQLTTPLGPSQ